MEQPKESLATQQFIHLKGVQNGVAILKNGGLRQLVMVSGINFELKSEEEQAAMTTAYQAFLNSLNFSVQIFIHSRRLNIERYLRSLSELELQEPNPLLRNQLVEYREFIKSFVSENAIMSKTFFIVVPFDPVQLPELGQKVTSKFFSLLSRKAPVTTTAQGPEAHFGEYASQLSQRTDQVIAGLNQIGLRGIALNDEETIELFYNLYNPEAAEKKDTQFSKGNVSVNG